MSRVLITGANGFVGKALYQALEAQGYEVIAGVRRPHPHFKQSLVMGDITKPLSFEGPIDIIVHCAALAHQLKGAPKARYHEVNVLGTQHVVEAGLKAGVKRFVYLSTIKVLGEGSEAGFSDESPPNPQDAYAKSKFEAECYLKTCAQKGLETVIIRPPLVYGQGVKGNVEALLKALSKGVPLPLKNIHNARSMIHVDNLCSFIACAIEHPLAKNETFVVADSDFSTPEFIRMLANQHHLKARLFSCPQAFLKLTAKLLGQQDRLDKLMESLKVSPNKAFTLLEWRPDKQVYTLRNPHESKMLKMT